jgi:hypothetical protein
MPAESSGNAASSYQEWLVTHEPKLFCPDDQVADHLAGFTYKPLLSILLPTFNTNPHFLERCLRSVSNQHYSKWQLCVVDDCSSDERVVPFIQRLADEDARIQLCVSRTNAGISAASNLALQMAQGEFIILLDHDDELHPFALFEVVAALNRHPDLDLIYSDEDKIDRDGHRVCPAFKPDFDFDIFLSFDYLGHMIALRRSVTAEVGGFRSSCNGAQDWDLLMRALEGMDAQKVHHIAKPLYHWRMHADSTALDLNSKPYVRRAWGKVLVDHLARTALSAEIEPGLFFGSMRIKRPINRGSTREASVAVFLRTEDGSYQIAALEPNVDSSRTFFYELLGSSLTSGAKWIWSFEEITEDVAVFINRPLETVNHLFFEELAAQAMRADCGLVTGISVDAGRVVHSGLIRDMRGQLMDPFVDLNFPHDGYLGQLSVVREVETISDEFFAVRREHLAGVGGLGSISAGFMSRLVQQLTTQAHKRGLRVLATPYAVATFEGVWPVRVSRVADDGRRPIQLNPNFASFANLAEVLSGNI